MSFNPAEFLVRLPDSLAHSMESMDFSEKEGYKTQNQVIVDEIQDIMVDVILIFLSLPVLNNSPLVVDKWHAAFERLFDTVKGLKFIMNPELSRPGPFEGRPGRFYLTLEEEMFITSFFQEFYDLLSQANILGEFQADDTWADPMEDTIAIYNYVREKKFGAAARRRKDKAPSLAQLFPAPEPAKPDDKEAVAAKIKAYLVSLVDPGSDTDASTDNLMRIAKEIDAQETSQVSLFFQSFRKQDFGRLYRPLRHSVNGDIFVDVLAKYYFEYAADPRIFNPPSFELIVKDMKRNRKCDSDVST